MSTLLTLSHKSFAALAAYDPVAAPAAPSPSTTLKDFVPAHANFDPFASLAHPGSAVIAIGLAAAAIIGLFFLVFGFVRWVIASRNNEKARHAVGQMIGGAIGVIGGLIGVTVLTVVIQTGGSVTS